MFCLSNQSTTIEVCPIHMKNFNIEERVTFKKLSREDLNYFYLWASDPDIAKSMTWEPYASIDEAEKFLREVVENHPWFKAICLDGIPIGSMTLNQGKGHLSCKAELGYVLAKAYWGKGITTAAVKKAIKEGFETLNISRIEALIDPENVASQKVLMKAGMNCEGLLKNYLIFKGTVKDRYIYSIVK